MAEADDSILGGPPWNPIEWDQSTPSGMRAPTEAELLGTPLRAGEWFYVQVQRLDGMWLVCGCSQNIEHARSDCASLTAPARIVRRVVTVVEEVVDG